MFKFTRNFLFFVILVATVNGADQNFLADVKSDVEALQEDLIEDLGAQRGQEIKRHYHHGYCPPGFTYLPWAQSCYKVVFESHDWYSAGRRCRGLRRGSHLVAITSAAENNALKKFLASELSKNVGKAACIPREWPQPENYNFWTSGQRLIENNCGSPFVWKLSSYKKLSFEVTSWKPGEPSCTGNEESCIDIAALRNFDWNDIPCYVKTCPICEYTPY